MRHAFAYESEMFESDDPKEQAHVAHAEAMGAHGDALIEVENLVYPYGADAIFVAAIAARSWLRGEITRRDGHPPSEVFDAEVALLIEPALQGRTGGGVRWPDDRPAASHLIELMDYVRSKRGRLLGIFRDCYPNERAAYGGTLILVQALRDAMTPLGWDSASWIRSVATHFEIL